jgi:type I restriction enzyme, S subunit
VTILKSKFQWKDVITGDVAAPERNSLVGGPFGSNLVSKDYTKTGVPVIRGQNMGSGRWIDGEFAFVSSEKAQELSSNIARPGDIIFTQRGTLGQVAIVPDSPYSQYIISQSQMKLTVNRLEADPLFVYYIFTTQEQQDYIKSHSIQTGVPHTNLGVLRKTPLKLPPLETQKAIASVLGALDDKIELNRRMNRTLESMARAIFKSWFVDFDPVKANVEGRSLEGLSADVQKMFPSSFDGDVPTGWESRGLDGIAYFLNGLALQKFPPTGDNDLPVIKIAQLRKGDTVGAAAANSSLPLEYVVEDGDVLFSWSGSLEAVLWTGGRGALNQHLFKVESQEFPKWFYYLWIHEHLAEFQRIAASKATTMGHIQRKHITQAGVFIPNREALEFGDEIIAPLVEQIVSNSLESRTLAETRDALLPKLLSGEVRVDDAEQEIGVVV